MCIVAWRSYVTGQTRHYKSLVQSWIRWSNKDKYVVFYEDLQANLIPNLNGIVQYLTGRTISPDIAECILGNSEGLFHRKSTETFDPYTLIPEEEEALMEMKEEVFAQIHSCIRSKNCHAMPSEVEVHGVKFSAQSR